MNINILFEILVFRILILFYFSYLSGLTFKETEPTYTKNGLVNLPKLAYVYKFTRYKSF